MQRVDLCFDALYAAIEGAPLFLRTKMELQSSVRYFKDQSLCDSDRKHPNLKSAWQIFIRQPSAELVLRDFRRTKHWPAIAEFFDEPIAASFPVTAMLTDFFYKLKLEAKELSIPWSEKLALRAGLKYLYLEAERIEKPVRQPIIRETWRFILPLMKKHRLLEKFKGQEELKRRLEKFLSQDTT